jgi:hypothetical protein
MRKALFGLVILGATLAGAQASAFDWLTWERLSERRTQDPVPQRFALKGHVFSIYPANAEHPAIFVAERRGRIVHLSTAERFNVVAFREREGGEGPDLLVDAQTASGGAGARLHAFVLGEKFVLQTIGLGDTYAGVDETGEASAIRVQFADYAFMGWNAAVHNSPAPNLQLLWTGEKYAVDPTSLRRARPNDSYDTRYRAQVRTALDAWKARGNAYVTLGARAPGENFQPPPSLLWRYMLNMIYSGDSPAAKRLFDAAWPEDLDGKDAFWRDFLTRLRQGQAWRDLDLETALDAAMLFEDFVGKFN